jgi:hypothetical protein
MKGVLFPPQPPDAPGSELSAGSVAGRAVRPYLTTLFLILRLRVGVGVDTQSFSCAFFSAH